MKKRLAPTNSSVLSLLFKGVIILLVLPLLFSCHGNKKGPSIKKIVIAEQYGLAYAPLQIMRIEGMLGEKLPGWEIKWDKLVNTAAIREAMLAGNLDIGFMAIPPFLVGYSNGMEWKIFTGLSSVPVELVTWKDEINSLADFTQRDRIALPQPGSIQHILLSMASEKQFGNARHFDNQLVTMAHPDGMNALIQKRDITAHFTSPPFIMQELEIPGFKSVLTGSEAAGTDFTFAVGAVTDSFSGANPEAVKALVSAIEQASAFIRENPDKATEILSAEYQTDRETLLSYLTFKGMDFGTGVKGVNEFAAFMKKSGYIKEETDISGIFFR